MCSSNQDPFVQLEHLLVLGQHIYQGLRRHVLFQMCDRQQSVQLFLHHSLPYVQKFREYRALIPKHLDYHLDLQDLHKLIPSAQQQVDLLIHDHLCNAHLRAILILYPNMFHQVPRNLRVRHRIQMFSIPLIRLRNCRQRSSNLPKRVSFHTFV